MFVDGVGVAATLGGDAITLGNNVLMVGAVTG
jgi:hypothetical protein